MSGDAIRWLEDKPFEGIARDGRAVRIEHSALSGRYVAAVPLRDQTITRRSCLTFVEARAAAEALIKEQK
ncbi:MAG: hypothetical protein NW206_19770 [Hyphomonadaceae bacterium]|nr:hypothetical protein [Hyphomonadaceae bacterium]